MPKNQFTRKKLIVIYCQEILKDIRLFTSQSDAKFYDSFFLNLDLSFVLEHPANGRKGYSSHAMVCTFIVMKCEGLSMVSDLVDYLNNNLLIAHYCGFDITSEAADSSVALDVLAGTQRLLSVKECAFLADKGYDVKNIYNQEKALHGDECIIPFKKLSKCGLSLSA